MPPKCFWKPSRSAAKLAAASVAIFIGAAQANAQIDLRPTIRDLIVGAPISAQPTNFQEFACGTNGGPPSNGIGSFADFAQCPAEETGLHEVQFRHDDESQYIALARRDPLQARLFQGTKIGNFAILASALIDDAGILRGIRAVTDDRQSDELRRNAYSMASFVRTLYRADGWDCINHPAEDGEQPLGNRLVKEDCSRVTDEGQFIITESRLLRRAGQTLVDPATGRLRAGLFESTARVEIYGANEAGAPIYSGDGPAFAELEPDETSVPDDPVEAFLIGVTVDCPGCDLAGADLKRRDLAGADLTGADLSGASLHRALLAGANLDNADLTGANLNLADLKWASLVGADLTDAFLYQADAAASDFSNSILNNVSAENARFTGAVMVNVQWQDSYAAHSNLAGVDLTGAVLARSEFPDSDFQGATLIGSDLADTWLYRSGFRGADLTGAAARGADFLQANLSNANFTDADLTDAQLLRARSDGMDLSGAIVTGTIMPDGSVGE